MKSDYKKRPKLLKLNFILFAGIATGLLLGGCTEGNQKEDINKESLVKNEEKVEKEPNKSLPVAITPEVGTPAPDFELEVLGDKEKKVSLSDLKGKKVMVHFFVSWCQFCQQQATENEKFYQEIKDREDVELVMVNLTVGEESIEEVSNHVSTHSITSPILLDSAGEAAFEYNIQVTPTNVFIDENGTIANIAEGAITQEDINSILDGM